MTKVVNVVTGEKQLFSLPPREAVRNAYAQEHGDWNTWDYGKYDQYVLEFPDSFSCGNWSAKKEG